MSGTTDHQPYAPNQEGVNGVLLDLKTPWPVELFTQWLGLVIGF